MKADVRRTFAKFERRTERIIAVLRLLALCILALVFWALDNLDSRQATMVPLGGFVLTTLAGLVTARRSLFLPWIPWLLTSRRKFVPKRQVLAVVEVEGGQQKDIGNAHAGYVQFHPGIPASSPNRTPKGTRGERQQSDNEEMIVFGPTHHRQSRGPTRTLPQDSNSRWYRTLGGDRWGENRTKPMAA